MNILWGALSAVGTFLVCKKLFTAEAQENNYEGVLAGPIVSANPRYKRRVRKTPRRAATQRCIFGRGKSCRFPVGDSYHERKALQYVQAGRCKPGECQKIVNYLARSAKDPEVRARARQGRKAIVSKAYSARAKRAATRARKR